MPRLIRLYIVQVVIGFVLSAIFVALLLWANVANLRHLVTATDAGLLAVGLLWVFNGIVFAGVQFGITIMRMAQNDDQGGGKRQNLSPELRPAYAVAPKPKRNQLSR